MKFGWGAGGGGDVGGRLVVGVWWNDVDGVLVAVMWVRIDDIVHS